jgi:hypothetical protein
MFITDMSKTYKATLQSGGTVAGNQLAEIMMDGDKLSTDQKDITDVLDQLSNFSRLVDPDLSNTLQ